MGETRRNSILHTTAFLLLIAHGIACKFNYFLPPERVSVGLENVLGGARPLTYAILFSWWGWLFQVRIVQKSQKKFFLGITAMTLLLLLLRTLKYRVFDDLFILRTLRYLYYFPMLLMPALFLMIALSIERNDDTPFSWPYWLIPAISAVQATVILFNDLHHLAFKFPVPPWSGSLHLYGPFYWFSVVWNYGYVFYAIAILVKKCRIPRSRQFLLMPLIPITCCVLYTVFYVLGITNRIPLLRDVPVDICLMYHAVLESCFQCGLIRANTHYADLFQAATIPIEITDTAGHCFMRSAGSFTYTDRQLRKCLHRPVMTNRTTMLSSAPVSCGYVLWAEDVTPLVNVIEGLNKTKRRLEESSLLLQKEYRIKARKARAAAQERLYNDIQASTDRQMQILSDLTEQLKKAANESQRRLLLGRIIVIGTYLKRRTNMIFLQAKKAFFSCSEITLAFGESAESLRQYGVSCSVRLRAGDTVHARVIMKLYDFFEEIIERSLDCMMAITVQITAKGADFTIRVNTDSSADLSGLAKCGAAVVRDVDGEWCLTMTCRAEMA